MRGLIRLVKGIMSIVQDVERKNLPVAAAGLAYYFVMSLFPALVVLTAIMAYLPLRNGMEAAVSIMANLLPRQAVDVIENILRTIKPQRSGLLSFGAITTVWLASVGFKGIILGLDMVYEGSKQRPMWQSRIRAFILTIAVGFLLLTGVVLSLAAPFMTSLLAQVGIQARPLWPYLQWILSALLIFAAIEILYILGPSMPASERIVLPGAILATIGWLVLAWGLGVYLHHFGHLKLDAPFGILASPVALMIWLYWNSTAILVGAEVNLVLQRWGLVRKRSKSKKVVA